jgi:hypothetical protein
MKLMHDDKYFAKEEILRRAKKYEYVNPLAVEIFLWDCELAAQLQNICDDAVLKGGAAAQMHLPLERQRGSIDVDMLTSLKKEDIGGILQKLDKVLQGSIRFSLYKPKKPNPNLPLQTYFARVPSKTDPKRDELEIKLDFLCEMPQLPHVTLEDVKTFAADIKRMKCSTAGALTGDKLLTLAKGSIGIELEADYPKQIYDIDALLGACDTSVDFVNDLLSSINTLTEVEASFRKLKVTPVEALDDVRKTTTKYSQVDTSSADAGIKKEVERFQQFFVNKSQRKPYYEWSSKSLRIRFLAILAQKVISEEITKPNFAKMIKECKETDLCLRKISGNAVANLRKEILKLAQSRIPHYKELKGKSLERVFWEVITPENIGNIRSLT